MPPTPPKKPFNLGRFSKTLSFWILVILIPVAFIQFSSSRGDSAPKINYSLYDQELQRDNLRRVTIQAGSQVVGEFKQPVIVNNKEARRFTLKLPMENNPAELERLRSKNVIIEGTDARPSFGALEIDITINDPTYYTKPWTATPKLRLVPDTELFEFICNENEKSSQHMGAHIK